MGSSRLFQYPRRTCAAGLGHERRADVGGRRESNIHATQSIIVSKAQRVVASILKLIYPPCILVRYSKSSQHLFDQLFSLKRTTVMLLADPNTKHLSDRGWLNFWKCPVQSFLFGKIVQPSRDIQAKFAEILLERGFREERVHGRVRRQLGDFASFQLLNTVICHSEL